MLALGSRIVWYKVYGCSSVRVRLHVEVSGEILGTQQSLSRDVNISFAVTQHWTPHVTIR